MAGKNTINPVTWGGCKKALVEFMIVNLSYEILDTVCQLLYLLL